MLGDIIAQATQQPILTSHGIGCALSSAVDGHHRQERRSKQNEPTASGLQNFIVKGSWRFRTFRWHGGRELIAKKPELKGPPWLAALMDFAVEIGAEEVYSESINGRGRGLKLCQEVLEKAGLTEEAAAFGQVRKQANWSAYTRALFGKLQRAARKRRMLPKLRFLLYPGNLTADDQAAIQRDDRGAIWLG